MNMIENIPANTVKSPRISPKAIKRGIQIMTCGHIETFWRPKSLNLHGTMIFRSLIACGECWKRENDKPIWQEAKL